MRFYSIIMIYMIFVATPVSADVGCRGKVTVVSVDSDGTLTADWGFGKRKLCNVADDIAAPTSTVKKETCVATYSMLLTLQASRTDFWTYHFGPNTCEDALGTDAGPRWPINQPAAFMSQPMP